MVLEYKFEYISNNNNYIVFLNNILKNSGLVYKIYKENDFILLYIQADENVLLEVSNEISQKLPMSIFLKNFTLEIVSEIPKKDYILNIDLINLSYCSNCVANIENEYLTNFHSSFFACNICGTTCDVSNIKFFKNKEELKYKNIKILLQDIALKIANNKRVKIKTKHCDFVFYKMKTLEYNNQKILCTNIEFLSKLVVSSEEKKVALTSLEKPVIVFNINEIFKRNNNIKFEKVSIGLANDIVLHFLSLELKKLGIEFLSYENSANYDYEISQIADGKKSNELLITMHNDRTFILKNDNYNEKLNSIYNKFKEASKAHFMVSVEENELHDKTLLNLYCSTKYDEQITLYSEQIDGMIDILNYNMPLSINDILNEISKSESGKRLLENYKDKFPKIFANCINQKKLVYENSSIISLWKIVETILGFEDPILENAKLALLKKGPRVDYKLIDSAKVYNREFNLVKLIQSGISFKLAGVDEKSLSLGYVESYAYFLANIIDDVNKELLLDGVILCGDLIADEFFYKMLTKAITKNFKLFYNKDFPIQL